MSDLDDHQVDQVLAAYLVPMTRAEACAVARAAKRRKRLSQAVVPPPRSGEDGPEARPRAVGAARPDHDGA